MENRPQFRFDHAYGSVYVWDKEQQAYVFCGKLNGMTEGEFIDDYYEGE